MIRVAMVCTGNICRSPMAASVASALVDSAGLGDQVEIESFGTSGYHVGEHMHRSAAAALARRDWPVGWPEGSHRARQITASDMDRFDLILCADLSNRADLLRLAGSGPARDKIKLMRSYDPTSGPDAEVPDPWGLADALFDESLDIVERSCCGLVSELAAQPR